MITQENFQKYETKRQSLLNQLDAFTGKVSFPVILDHILRISSLMIPKERTYDQNGRGFIELPIGELAKLISLLNRIQGFSEIPNFFLFQNEKSPNPLDSLEWKFIQKLNHLLQLDLIIEDFHSGFNRESYNEDLAAFNLSNTSNYLKKNVIEQTYWEGEELIKLEREIDLMRRQPYLRFKRYRKKSKEFKEKLAKRQYLSVSLNLERL